MSAFHARSCPRSRMRMSAACLGSAIRVIWHYLSRRQAAAVVARRRQRKEQAMKRTTAVLAATALVVLVAGAATSATSASSTKSLAGNQLSGAWQATVNLPAPLPPLLSLQVFDAGGGFTESSHEPPATRSVLYGNWDRIEGRLYAATGIHFRFDRQTGAYLGTRKVDRTIELSRDGQLFLPSPERRHTTRTATSSESGRPPQPARAYPSTGSAVDATRASRSLSDVCRRHRDQSLLL